MQVSDWRFVFTGRSNYVAKVTKVLYLQVLHVAILVILLSLVDKSIGIRYEESGGRHQGDLVLTDLQLDAASSGGTQLVHDAYKWVKGIVPYEIASAFSE